MADRQFVIGGILSTPADWHIPASLEIVPKTAYASFDGSAATSPYFPCLRVISDSGHVVAEAVSTTQVAAGGSADCSWFPHVGGQVSGTSILPINPAISGNIIFPMVTVIGTRALQPSPASFLGNGHSHIGARVLITRSGVLHDLAIYIGTHAGNAEVAIIDTNTPTRNIIYASGLVALAADHSWQVIGDPALGVTVGDQYDIAVGLDNGAATVMWLGGLVNSTSEGPSGQLPTNFDPVPGGAPPKTTWQDAASGLPYGGQTTIAEATLTPQQNQPLVIGRIA